SRTAPLAIQRQLAPDRPAGIVAVNSPVDGQARHDGEATAALITLVAKTILAGASAARPEPPATAGVGDLDPCQVGSDGDADGEGAAGKAAVAMADGVRRELGRDEDEVIGGREVLDEPGQPPADHGHLVGPAG